MKRDLPKNIYLDKRRGTYFVHVRRKKILRCMSGLKKISDALLWRDFFKSITIEEFKKVDTRNKCFEQIPSADNKA